MADFACDQSGKSGINERAERVRQHPPGSNQSDPMMEDRSMADYSPYSNRSGGDNQEDASFDDFDAMRHAMLDCIAFGMPAELIQPLLRRAENVCHAKVMFMLARDSFELDFISGESAKVARRISAAVRGEVFARDGRKCAYCGDTNGPFHIDHIRPVAAGGSGEASNLTVACATCNLSKGAKVGRDWRGRK